MSTFRVKKDKENPYVMLNKSFLKDNFISWKAKGLLAYLLSLPDNWQVYESELVKHATDGKDSLKSTIKELIKAGYIERGERKREKGKLKGYEYTVNEVSNQSGKSYVGKSAHTNNDFKLNNKIYLHLSTKEALALLSKETTPYLKEYLEQHSSYLGKNHVRVSKDKVQYIDKKINTVISNGITLEQWSEVINEYFETLPTNNNGSILAFLKALPRFFTELRKG